MTALGIRTGGLTTQTFSWLAKKHHLTENEVRDLDARYKAADLDRSGQLDKQELTAFLKHTIAAKATDAGIERFLASQWHNVDRDGNGTVDFDEFLSLYAVLKAHPTQAAEKQAAEKQAAAPAATTKAAAPAAATKSAKATTATKAAPAGSGSSSAKGLGVSKKEKRQKRKAALRKRPRTFPTNPQLNQQNYISQDIVWSAIRKQNAFLVTRPNGRYGTIRLTREPGNLTNTHSIKHSGLIHNRTVDISPANGALNLRLNVSSARKRNQPARQYTNSRLVADNRQLSATLRRQLQNYRKTAIPAALARASKLRYASAHGGAPTSKREARRAAASNTAAPSAQ